MSRTVELLAQARRNAGLSQRELALKAGVPQASVSRIERGLISPRASTVERWLATCGMALEIQPQAGAGIDLTGIRERLAMTPSERSDLGIQEARASFVLGDAPLRRTGV